jgi:hypothetical protein
MKIFTIIFFSIFLNNVLHSQNNGKLYEESSGLLNLRGLEITSVNLKTIIQSEVNKDESGNELKDSKGNGIKKFPDFMNSVYIVFTSVDKFETKKIDNNSSLYKYPITSFLFEDGIFKENTSKIFDRTDISVLIIGDYIATTHKPEIKIEPKTNSFKSSLNDLIKIITKSIAPELAGEKPFVLLKLKSKEINLPSDLTFTFNVEEEKPKEEKPKEEKPKEEKPKEEKPKEEKPKEEKPKEEKPKEEKPKEAENKFIFNLTERNYLLFKVGVIGFNNSRNLFKIDNGSITVSPDNSKPDELKGNLVAFLELHMGRDQSDYNPTLFNWKVNNIERFGLIGGINISKDLLGAFYLGLNIDLTKEFSLVGGAMWNNTYENQTQSIGSITSLDDAKDFLQRKYIVKGFFGISFAPSAFFTTLGIK